MHMWPCNCYRHIEITNWKLPNGVSNAFGVCYLLTALICICGHVNISNILIFRIEGEQPHQDFLLFYCFLATRPQSNTTAGRLKASRRRVRFRPVGQKAIEKHKILVCLLAFKLKNKYLAFCSCMDQLFNHSCLNFP